MLEIGLKKKKSVQCLYLVLVGETPDPSSHLHSKDEEKEEEELIKTREVCFNAQENLPDFKVLQPIGVAQLLPMIQKCKNELWADSTRPQTIHWNHFNLLSWRDKNFMLKLKPWVCQVSALTGQ